MCLSDYLQSQTLRLAIKKETLIAFAKLGSLKNKRNNYKNLFKSMKLNEKDFKNAKEEKVFRAGEF